MPSVVNFSAGPAILPQSVLHTIRQEITNWHKTGLSILEISHRDEKFLQAICEIEQDLRDLLAVPHQYRILFMQGGARGQFAAVPLNLLGQHKHIDYIDSGYWSRYAAREGQQYCIPNLINISTVRDGLRAVHPMHEWPLSKKAAIVHYCPNETIDGISIDEQPNCFGKDKIIVADMSSTLLSRPLDVTNFGLIYACAQKNIGPAGVTLVIIREDLLGNAHNSVPSVLNYTLMAQHQSLYNTPPVFAWYCCGLVFKWIKSQGGLSAIAADNEKKAATLYQIIDTCPLYCNSIHKSNRSWMNIPFKLIDHSLHTLFLQQASSAGLYALKGHSSVGNIRASLYNAMTFDGVNKLINFMLRFFKKYFYEKNKNIFNIN